MERKIGETFEYEGKKLRVEADKDSECKRCCLNERCPDINQKIIGECVNIHRQDKTSVVFVEINDEHPQELNLCKILKNCPKETELYSPMYGKVYFNCVFNSGDDSIIYCYKTRLREGCTRSTNSQCTDIVAFYNNGTTGNPDFNITSECMLFPSVTQRDWSKFTASWLKKKRFDPKTLQPFDGVLIKYEDNDWICSFFSKHEDVINSYPIHACVYCIPYNNETKHLVGTTDEAPEYYRYWED